MVLPILIVLPIQVQEAAPAPEPVAANERDALIRYRRRVLCLPPHPTGSWQGRAMVRHSTMFGAMTEAESYDLLRDCERLTRLLLRRSWASLPRRQRRWIRSREV